MTGATETPTYVPSPEQFWADRTPEKARIFLRPAESTEAALAAFFYELDEEMPTIIRNLVRRTYGHLPGLAIATLALPHEMITTDDPREAYDAMINAAQDFKQAVAKNRVCISNPEISSVRYDGNTILGACFRGKEALQLFPRVRRRYIGDAMASISCQNPDAFTNAKVDKHHLPDVVLPILRPYRGEQASSIHPWLADKFRQSFPKNLTFEPVFVPSHPMHASEQNPTTGPDSFEVKEEISLLERALISARVYPRAEVRYFGNPLDIQTTELPTNLQVNPIDGPAYLHISH